MTGLPNCQLVFVNKVVQWFCFALSCKNTEVQTASETTEHANVLWLQAQSLDLITESQSGHFLSEMLHRCENGFGFATVVVGRAVSNHVKPEVLHLFFPLLFKRAYQYLHVLFSWQNWIKILWKVSQPVW